MIFEWRVLTVGLAVFAAISIVISALVPMLLRRVGAGDGASRDAKYRCNFARRG